MPQVLCTLPNASELINGVKFAAHAKGLLSEDVSDEVAANFASIPGYELVGAKPPAADSGDADKAAERAALEKKAAELNVKVKGSWGNDRLRAEIETAEKVAADAAATEAAAAEKKAADEKAAADAAAATAAAKTGEGATGDAGDTGETK